MFNQTDDFRFQSTNHFLLGFRSHLIYKKRPVDAFIRNEIICDQFETESGFLIFSSDDDDYEVSLTITLLDKNFTLLDYLYIGAPFRSGYAFGVTEVQKHFLLFEFWRTVFHLSILEHPVWYPCGVYDIRIPLFKAPDIPISRSIWRRIFRRSYFKISLVN